MKKIYLLLIVCIATFEYAKSQSQDIEMSELKTPTAPAFSLLGISPNEISRPKAMNDVELALMNGFFQDGKVQIPKQLALETNPRWLLDKKVITLSEWYTAGFGEQLWRNLSVSIATAPRVDPNNANNQFQQLSAGARTQFHFMYMKDNAKMKAFLEARQEFEDNAWATTDVHSSIAMFVSTYNVGDYTGCSDFECRAGKLLELIRTNLNSHSPFSDPENKQKKENLNNAINQVKASLSAFAKDPTNGPDITSQTQFKSVRDKLDTKIEDILRQSLNWRSTIKKLRDTYNGPTSFFVEVGGAYAQGFENGNLGNSKPSRWGIWINPTFRFNGSDKLTQDNTDKSKTNSDLQGEFIMSLRYIQDFITVSGQKNASNLDLGCRVVLRWKRLSASGEILYRHQWQMNGTDTIINGQTYILKGNNLSDWKGTVNIEYRLTNSFSLTYTFGKDFGTNPIHQGGNLINLIGGNLGIAPALAKLLNK